MIAPEVTHNCLRAASPPRGPEGVGLTREEILAPPPRVAAARRIGRPIREALMKDDPTDRVPAAIVGLLTRMRRADRALRRELGRSPSFEEIAAALGLTPSQKALATWALRSPGLRPSGSGAPGEDEPILWPEE